MIRFRRLVVPTCVAVVILTASPWPPVAVPVRAAPPGDREMEELYEAVQDSARALPAEQRVRQILADDPSSGLLRHLVTVALISRRAPTDVLMAYAESTLAVLPPAPQSRSLYLDTVIRELTARGERLEWADSLARLLVRSSTEDLRLPSRLRLARVFEARGLADSTVALLTPLTSRHPDEAELFRRLGRAHERLGRGDEAMSAYVRAAGVWLGPDTTVLAGLRALGAGHGLDAAELERRLKEERRASHRRVVFEAPRVDRPAPRWAGRTLEGRRVRDRDFAGRIVVLKFWGTWCAPCMETLHEFQEFYSDTLPPGVALLTVNREHVQDPGTRTRVRALMRERGWTFPAIFDSTGALADAFGVTSYPTTVVVDRSGRIRYANRSELRGQYLARRQVKALLEEGKDRGRATPR
jgi:peroxiredoxin